MCEKTAQKIETGDSLLKRGDLAAAARIYKEIIEKEPDNAYVYVRLGDIFRRLGNFDSAKSSYKIALKYDRKRYDSLTNLGNIYWSRGRMTDALKMYQTSIEIKPDVPQTLGSMALCLCECGRVEEALEKYRDALEIKPDYAGLRSNMLLCLNYDNRADRKKVFEQHKKWGEIHGAGIVKKSSVDFLEHQNRLRVGYVSPDFRRHSVAYFIEPVLKNHCESVETFCYSNLAQPDEVTEKLKGYSDNWREIYGVSDEECADMICRDGIDILVDLAGHMSNGRLGVFALKPAPVQVTWLGYPNTTGLGNIDYRLTDTAADPEGEEVFYTERLWRLEPPFLCYSNYDENEGFPDHLPAEENGFVTFGSFNMMQKINSEVIDTWASLLRAVDRSRLFLKCKSFTDSRVGDELARRFQRSGIEKERLIFRGHTASDREHLRMYNSMDIALDTFPYNGTTTTCEAMWMGVPVIVLKGKFHAGRAGLTLLKACGMEQYAADSKEEYIEKAEALAGKRETLKEIKQGIRKRMKKSRLCDAAGFTQRLEAEYRKMLKNRDNRDNIV